MSSQATGLLPGQSPPLTVITSTDHSGFVLIATTLGLVFTLVSLLIRVYVRYECSNSFARDDVAVTVAGVRSTLVVSVYEAIADDFPDTLHISVQCSIRRSQERLWQTLDGR